MRCWRSLEEQIQKEALEQKRFWEGRGWDHMPIDDALHALAEASRKYDGEPTTTAPHAMPALEKWAKKYGSTVKFQENRIKFCPHGLSLNIEQCVLCSAHKGNGGVTMQQPDGRPIDGEVKCLACGKALNRTDKNCYACGSTKLSEYDDAIPSGEVSAGDSNTLQIPDSLRKQAETLRQNTIRDFEEYLKRSATDAAPTPAPPSPSPTGTTAIGGSIRRTYWENVPSYGLSWSPASMAIKPLVMNMLHAEAQRLDVLLDACNFTLLHCFSGGRLASNISMRRAMDIGTRIEAILVQEGF